MQREQKSSSTNKITIRITIIIWLLLLKVTLLSANTPHFVLFRVSSALQISLYSITTTSVWSRYYCYTFLYVRKLRNREDKQFACGCVARKYRKDCWAGLLAKVENEAWQRPRPPWRAWRKGIPGREHGWGQKPCGETGRVVHEEAGSGARARIRQKIKQAGIWYGTPGGPVLSVEFIVLVAKGIYFKAFAEVEWSDHSRR